PSLRVSRLSLHDALPISPDARRSTRSASSSTTSGRRAPELLLPAPAGATPGRGRAARAGRQPAERRPMAVDLAPRPTRTAAPVRSEEHTSELQSPYDLVC